LRALRALAGEPEPAPRWPGFGMPPPATDYRLPPKTFIVAPARHQVVFRLLGFRPEPRVRDFESNFAKGRPQAPDETYADYLGVSVFASEQLAIENAVNSPKHVAAVLLPDSEGFSIARTYPEVEGHYTIWGDPERLVANVERIETHEDPEVELEDE
jgi:hypothetical protein